MDERKKKIAKIVILIVLLASLIGLGVYIAAKLLKQKKEDSESEDLEIALSNASPLNGQTQQSAAIEQIKKMQALLLNIGINYNNNQIIDAIQLTGGIDGIMGDGFNLALNVAIENGYVESLDDLRSRVS